MVKPVLDPLNLPRLATCTRYPTIHFVFESSSYVMLLLCSTYCNHIKSQSFPLRIAGRLGQERWPWECPDRVAFGWAARSSEAQVLGALRLSATERFQPQSSEPSGPQYVSACSKMKYVSLFVMCIFAACAPMLETTVDNRKNRSD